jgi:hypothetical protein
MDLSFRKGWGVNVVGPDRRAGLPADRKPRTVRTAECGPFGRYIAREAKGRVEIFNPTRPGGLDNWAMDLSQYEAMRHVILELIDDEADEDGTIRLKDIVAKAQDRYAVTNSS